MISSDDHLRDANDPSIAMRAAGDAIVAGIEAHGPAWAVRAVDRILDAWGRVPVEERDRIGDTVRGAGEAASARVVAELQALLAQDVADQRSTPLELVRTLVVEPTEVLRELGVPEVVRDPFDERMQPDDVYDLAPRSLADLDPDLGPELLAWGLTKSRLLRDRVESDRAGAE